MMSNATARFALPFLFPGQAQKEMFHNEALARLDGALHPAVEGDPIATPPDVSDGGRSWLVGAGAGGSWSGRDHALAFWTSGGWRFVAPVPGMIVWNKARQCWIHWSGSAWSNGEFPVKSLWVGGVKVVGERQPQVPSPSGGTIIDAEAREAIAAITAALKSHGLTE